MYVNNQHIKKWIAAGKAVLVSADTSAKFSSYLDTLPWNPLGTGLDWARLRGSTANLSKLSAPQLEAWFSKTAIGKSTHLVFFYSPSEPCLACALPFAIENIDSAFWSAPGRRYIFGANFANGMFEPALQCFVEYNGADILVANLPD